MGSVVKCLPCKHEDLSKPIKKLIWLLTSVTLLPRELRPADPQASLSRQFSQSLIQFSVCPRKTVKR